MLVNEHGNQKTFYNDLLLAQIAQEEENTELQNEYRNDFSMALEHQKYESMAQEKEDFKKLQVFNIYCICKKMYYHILLKFTSLLDDSLKC